MLAGARYDAADPTLRRERAQARVLLHRFNSLLDPVERLAVLGSLLGHVGEGAFVEPPFRCDYGYNIHLGAGAFVNFDCVILDVCPVRIGAGTLLGPGVHIYAATHPTAPDERARGLEAGQPVTIGANVWVGGRALLLPGVTVGDGAVVGAGAVVTRDVPAGVLVVGNPARAVRAL